MTVGSISPTGWPTPSCRLSVTRRSLLRRCLLFAISGARLTSWLPRLCCCSSSISAMRGISRYSWRASTPMQGSRRKGRLIERRHRQRGALLYSGEHPYVAERFGEDVAGSSQARLVALRDRRASKADRDAAALGPVDNLARRYHGPGVGLARRRHRHLEINLLAPGHRRCGNGQCRRDCAGGHGVEKLGIERERAEVEADARHLWSSALCDTAT